MKPVRSGGEISYAVLEVIYDDRKVRQSAVHKCHAQLPCKCLARYQARPCLALRTALVHGKIPKPERSPVNFVRAHPEEAKIEGCTIGTMR